ncbi:MAG TPA: pyrroline-5-carboxylate reductase [Virgibacillus sp.]|nr:pyrroline-5-carboxylate reductase [Virgibacillus sp.]
MIGKIAIVGAGTMSEAIISGILNKEFLKEEEISVTNKNNQERLNLLQERYGIHSTHDKKETIQDADLIILSVKPYDIKETIDSIKEYIRPGQLIVSVVAGISTDYISELIGNETPVIRAMPNTSASIGMSATAITKGEYAVQRHLNMCEALFNTIGMTVVINEADMHAVTSVSGSGPAYVYYLVEALEKAAMQSGLDRDVAQALITQTIRGAGEMLQQSAKSAESLRKGVTSPAGTTEAAIETLDKQGFQGAVIAGVESARDRSAELGKKE